jgi:tetratricopeptide (TPR) repeat protein
MPVPALFLGIVFICFFVPSPAQTRTIDSLKSQLSTDNDTLKIITLNDLAWQVYLLGNYQQGMDYSNQAIALANKLPALEGKMRDKCIAHSWNNIGNIYSDQSEYDKALEAYRTSLALREKIQDKKGMSASWNNMGGIHRFKGDLDKSLECHLRSLQLKEEIGDKKGMASSYNNIGNIYNDKGDRPKALDFYFKSLKLKEEIGNKLGIADSYVSIGIIYKQMNNLDLALDFYLRGCKIYEDLGNKQRTSISYNNIGNLYEMKGEFDKALLYDMRSLKLREQLNDRNGMAACYANIGNVYMGKLDFHEARKHLLKGYELAGSINAKPDIMAICKSLSLCDSALGNFKSAFTWFRKYSVVRDSILNEASAKRTAEMQSKYESDKKEQQIKLLELDNSLLEKDSELERFWRYALMAGISLALLVSLLLLNRYRLKQKANVELAAKNEAIQNQKELIETQHDELSLKNKEITDSIRYSMRIQQAILPPDAFIKTLLPHSFVLFKPKDIVSGDFYWVERFGSQVVVAVVDCTGHGVPGAFMSFVAYSLLNEAVNEHGITKPSVILSEMRKGLFKMFRQTAEGAHIKDGMDIAVCSIDLQRMNMEFAGAHNPCWIVRGRECIELKADKVPIGAFVGDAAAPFTHHEFKLLKGDHIYLFTDGYPDQFGLSAEVRAHSVNVLGNPDSPPEVLSTAKTSLTKGKKFKHNRLRDLLISIQHLPHEEQKNVLDKNFMDWKGGLEQVDDVCIMGIGL